MQPPPVMNVFMPSVTLQVNVDLAACCGYLAPCLVINVNAF
jgi:hypothetical protein